MATPKKANLMEHALNQLWTTLADYVPRVFFFLVILILGWLIAKLIGKAINKILERVGFDRAVERGGVKRALTQSKYDASEIVGKLVYYTLVLFVLQMAFGVFGPNPISDLLTRVITFLPSLIIAIVIIVVVAAIAAAVRELISNTLGGLPYGKILANIAAVSILGLGIIAALNQVGIATTVTLPVLIAVLATLGGILVVGVGGGLIKPMQNRWESYLQTMEEESKNIRGEAKQAPSSRAQAEATAQKVASRTPAEDPRGSMPRHAADHAARGHRR